MHMSNIFSFFQTYNESIDERNSLKNQNILVCLFGSFLMFIGAIASFLSLYFILNEDFSTIWLNSFVMAVMGSILLGFLRLLKNEIVKTYVFSAIFSAYLIFVVIQYYIYIGPAVWTISIIVAMTSILYENKRMLFIITITITIIVIWVSYNHIEFYMWGIFYLAQAVTLGILFMVIITVHGIIKTRTGKIREQYKNILKSEEKLYLTLKSVGDGVITVNEKGIIEFVNPIAQKLTGWSQAEAVGESFETVFNIINEYTRDKVKSPVGLVFEKKQIIELANHTLLISKDGTEKPIEDTAAPIIYENDTISGVVLVFRDYSEKKEKQKRIEYLSYHDQLTGLYNRRFFEEGIKRLDTNGNLPLSFVYADVNGLKIINDAFGHESGDQIIQWVADVLKTECRFDDIIARVGGDEFVILLPKTDAASVEKLVERLNEKIERKKIMDIQMSVSFGWSTKNEDNQSAADTLKNAEDFMYQKKIFNSGSKRNGIIKAILNALLVKCPREEAHSKRVSAICEDIGKAYQLNVDDIKELKTAGELHDIGKIAVDENILNKSGDLSKSDWAQIKHHPEIGYRLLGATSEFNNIADYVLAHHERWDGTGYPKGLKGEAINWKARVIALADAYDAVTRERPYQKALSKEDAIMQIKQNAGTQFDPDIARVFVEKVLGAQW